MKKPLKTFEAFDVVVVPFPFIDANDVKRRPALILSSVEHFGSKINASILAMITSAKHSHWPFDIGITDLQIAGLKADSIIRMKLFTLDHRLILESIGRLGQNDQNLMKANLKKLFF